MTNYLLPEIVPGHRAAHRRHDLAVRLPGVRVQPRDRGGHGLHLRPAGAAPTRRPRLEIPADSPLLVVRRVTYAGGRPIEVAILHVVADQYEYCVHTQGAARRARMRRSSMTLTARDVARLIDISAVQAPHGEAEIREMVASARRSTASSRCTCCPAG